MVRTRVQYWAPPPWDGPYQYKLDWAAAGQAGWREIRLMTVFADSHYRLHPGHAMLGPHNNTQLSSDVFLTQDHRGEPGVTKVESIGWFYLLSGVFIFGVLDLKVEEWKNCTYVFLCINGSMIALYFMGSMIY